MEITSNTLKTITVTRGAIGIVTRVDTLQASSVRNRSRVLLSGDDMILICNESELGCFEKGVQYTAEKPMGLSPKLPFIVVTDTYGHLWYAEPRRGTGRYVVRSSDGAMRVTFTEETQM